MSGDPFFSIVLATFDRGDHIRPTIQSVLQQTFSDFELLVVGDGCNDTTEQAVKSFGSAKISWRNLPQNSGGQSAPNNLGIRHARGSWIAYIGHDDVWTPDHLLRLREAIGRNNAIDFVVSGCILYGPEGSDVYYVSGFFETADAPFRHFFPPSSIAHQRDVVNLIGDWMPPLSTQAPVDVDFLLRAARAGLRFASTGRVTVHKFAAGHRYLSYLSQSSAEQYAMLRVLRDNDDRWLDRIIETAKRQGTFMAMVYADFSKREAGALFKNNRKKKGLSWPPLRPLETRTVIEQSDGPRVFDWHAREGRFRWSGPNPRPRILIPCCGGEARIAIEVVAVAPRAALKDVSVFAGEQKLDCAVERTASGSDLLAFRTRLKPSEPTVLILHTPSMFRPSDIEGADARKLGIAVADIVLEPL